MYIEIILTVIAVLLLSLVFRFFAFSDTQCILLTKILQILESEAIEKEKEI